MIPTAIVAVAALAMGAFLFSPRARRSEFWRATVTPLASIIGSGFLVSAPLLAGEVGALAVFAVAALAGLGYLLGVAIRFNIRHAEPLLEHPGRHKAIAAVEGLSHLVLAFAYFISVAYYLALLSAFALKGLGQSDPVLARSITTAILIGIGAMGALRGLKLVEQVEEYAVSIKLAVIAALIAGLAWHNGALALGGGWGLDPDLPTAGWDSIRVLLGLLIIVQGFETSRFMGSEYDADTRVATMRAAQLIAAAIYVVFVSLMTVLFHPGLGDAGVADIIDMVGPVAVILPLMLTIAALASQFSASVADSIGAAGLIHEVTRKRVSLRMAYPVIALVAIGVTWAVDVFGVINLASRAFALFYLVQCCVALIAAWRHGGPWRPARLTLFGALALFCLAVVVFSVPFEGES